MTRLQRAVDEATAVGRMVDLAPLMDRWAVGGPAREITLDANGFYCRALAAHARLQGVKHCLELGTCWGTSALSIGLGAEKVTTCDVSWAKLVPGLYQVECVLAPWASVPDFTPGDSNVQAVLLDDPDKCVFKSFALYDMIFVDIGLHEGRYESLIHERLLETDWRGFAFYDDINWPGMKRFWETVSNDKIVANWHGDAGVGVVLYGG